MLLVAKLDRLSRSLLDFASLMARSQAEGWSLVALDLGVDTSTPAGEFMASVMASAAQWERRIIGQRTRDALAAKSAQGVQLGRPPSISPEVARYIHALRSEGLTVRTIAARLSTEAVPTVGGPTGGPRPPCSGCWRQHEDAHRRSVRSPVPCLCCLNAPGRAAPL